ncbi:MAG: ATP-dependent RNA helicase HrpA [Phycisphaerae bacterium]|nr:ATP-dependent RNA helicase HrpA [Phycisphaerae bacterium]
MSPASSPILPILERRAEIEAAVARHRVVVICGETGSGKTTQLPRICLEMGRAAHGIIGHTQPRRLAARAVAARIAEERGESLGGIVGSKVRFQDQTSRQTRIKVMTDGVLLAELGTDPDLISYSTIIIDEAHERSLNIDFLLGYLRHLLTRRDDLKVIVTSATIDPQRFSTFFGGPARAPVIEVSGRTYPVDVRYRAVAEDDEEFERLEVEAVADAVDELCSPRLPEGDVLVFVPGEREIRQCGEALKRRGVVADVLPLYSRLTNQEQDRIFHPGDRRRVIISTNVAETSLTVPGIRYVVDTGYARLNRYDPQRKIQRLPIEAISQASANQRSGRCGRTAAGVCIRLYSEESYRSRPRFTDPEVLRTSLAGAILRMKSLGLGPIEEFPFLDPPNEASIRDGYETLFELGAITSASGAGALTEVGRGMSRIPLDPRIARMLIAAEREGSLRELVVLAGALSIPDPRDRPMGKQDQADRAQMVFRDDSSDFLTLLRVWDQYSHAETVNTHGGVRDWCREHFLSPTRMREWVEMVRQLREVADELGLRRNEKPASPDAIHRALLTGLITNAACREGESGSFDYRGVRGNTLSLFPGSVLFKKNPKWIMAAEVVQTSRLFARTLARIDPAWVEELAGHMFQRQLSDKHLDVETGQPSAWERVTMSGIVVVPRRRAALAPTDPTAARAIFLREGLAQCKWRCDAPFMVNNRRVLDEARQAEAMLRRRNVVVTDDALSEWFERRVPPSVTDPETFERWRPQAEQLDARVLHLSLADVVEKRALEALGRDRFPSALRIEDHAGVFECPLRYALAPGKDEDGVTATVLLADLPRLSPERTAWLVPGMLPELVQSLMKTLPKPLRDSIEAKGTLERVGAPCVDVMSFGVGPLDAALSEAIAVLYGVQVPREAWSFKGLPAHLRLRVRVVNDQGIEQAVDRDLPALVARFQGKIQRARASAARAAMEREGITTWDFGAIADPVRVERDGVELTLHPALVDRGDSVSLVLEDTPERAALESACGVRRLFALACADEVGVYLSALPQWPEMSRQYGAFGTPDALRDALTCVVAERVFIAGQPAVRSRDDFEARSRECWGRLAMAAREVGETVARVLDARAKVAHRLSGGTPRLWAESVADMREHAAYLMPRGFLLRLSWERLKRYPIYAQAMRERLLSLREDGKGAETEALRLFLPHWKKFTGWVARAMSAGRALSESPEGTARASPRGKAPLPQAKRAAPSVNLDAGEWAMSPGNLPASVERYRWALEELRVALFSPSDADKNAVALKEVQRLWAEAGDKA